MNILIPYVIDKPTHSTISSLLSQSLVTDRQTRSLSIPSATNSSIISATNSLPLIQPIYQSLIYPNPESLTRHSLSHQHTNFLMPEHVLLVISSPIPLCQHTATASAITSPIPPQPFFKHSLSCEFTHSLCHSYTHSLSSSTDSLSHQVTHSLMSLIHPFSQAATSPRLSSH